MQVVHLQDYGFVPDIIGTSCTNSIQLKDLDFRVPCGKCYYCQKKRRSEWSLRLEHEYMFSDSAHFITLTYNDQSLPFSWLKPKQLKDDKGNVIKRWKEVIHSPYPTLNKKHLQDYIKRLRNSHKAYLKNEQRKVNKEFKITGKPIRYYAVGEYGSKDHTRRPHYHLLLFNYDIANVDNIISQWKNTTTGQQMGHVDVGEVTSASINYVTKYMFKDFNKRTDTRQSPFSVMSKKPIIGNDYIVNYGKFHTQNEQLQVADKNGHLRRLPKAYLYRLWYNEFEVLGKKYRVKDTLKIKELSKKNHDEFIKSRMKRYEDTILKHYNGDTLEYERSLESDIDRQKRNINFKETI